MHLANYEAKRCECFANTRHSFASNAVYNNISPRSLLMLFQEIVSEFPIVESENSDSTIGNSEPMDFIRHTIHLQLLVYC